VLHYSLFLTAKFPRLSALKYPGCRRQRPFSAACSIIQSFDTCNLATASFIVAEKAEYFGSQSG
jgi:hypothetical protein